MKNVMYGLPAKYDTGVQPSICLNNNNNYLEVHKSENNQDLWYRYGQIGTSNHKMTITNQAHAKTNNDGFYPASGLNDNGTAVTVFQDTDPSSGDAALKYMVGIVGTDGTVGWGSEHSCSLNGRRPAVIVSPGNHAIMVYEQTAGTQLAMVFGTIDTVAKTIQWETPTNYTSGHNPRIAMNGSGHLVEVHDYSGALMYDVGTVSFTDLAVTWGDRNHAIVPVTYAPHNGSVAINDDGFVIVLYQLKKASAGPAHETGDSLWDALSDKYDALNSADVYGTLVITGTASGAGSTSSVAWEDPQFVGWGNLPAIACNRSFSMIAQLGAGMLDPQNSIIGNDGELSFYTSRVMDIGNYTDRANWMQNNFADVPLNQLMIPAAHDAGMYSSHDCTMASSDSTQTQNKTFAEMLELGIRYFDIRPSYGLHNDFYCYHMTADLGCYGALVTDILNDVNNFLANHKEVVILKFSHYDFPNGNSDKITLENKVATALSGKLISSSHLHGRIAGMTVNQIVTGTTGIAIPVFEPYSSSDGSADYSGLYTYADYNSSHSNPTAADLVVYDNYSDDDSLQDMRVDQLSKLHNAANHGGDFFLLSWTLTQQIFEGGSFHFDQLNSAIEDFAILANNALTQVLSDQQQQQKITLSTLPNLVYVDFCDRFVTDICTWLNYCKKNGYIYS